MNKSFEDALAIARECYPYEVNHFEENEEYFVFDYDDGFKGVYYGGDRSPIVIRKSDLAALNYAPIFFNMEEGCGSGPVLNEGVI